MREKRKSLEEKLRGVNPNPKQDSKRSIKRKSRGFVSLEVSSRKHRRAHKRLGISQTVGARGEGGGGIRYKAGATIDPQSSDMLSHAQHAGGRLNYW